MRDWRFTTLGQFVSLQRGHDLPTDQRSEGDVPVMGSFGITGWHNVARANGPGVTVGRSGASIGVVSYIDRAYWPLNTCLFATEFHGNSPRFVYYFLKMLDLAAHNSGSAQPSLNRNYIAPIKIKVPDRPEQDDIVNLLGSLDDKIELNRRMNETLEAMAQAIFRDWFVDFGPTRRKIDGATDPVEIMGGLVADPDKARKLADLFPAKLGDDGLPEGWIETPIGDLARLKGGKQLPKQQFNPDGSIPVFGGAGLMGFADRYNAEGYVITVGRVGAYCGRFVAYRGKAWVNNNASVIMPVSGVPSEWLFLALLQLDIETIKKGAAQPFISNGDLAVLKTVQPTAEVLHEFQRLVKSIIEMKELNERQMATLAATRDLLLPKLMSGEVRLRDAEREIEAVA